MQDKVPHLLSQRSAAADALFLKRLVCLNSPVLLD